MKSSLKAVGIGISLFEKIIERNAFYIDKTDFIREWWNSPDDVTLLTRPRRFGKTLMLSTVESFFSTQYAGRGEELFGDLNIWSHEEFRKMQGTFPVISLSLHTVREKNFERMVAAVRSKVHSLFSNYRYLLKSEALDDQDKEKFLRINAEKETEQECAESLRFLSECIFKHTGKRAIILLDEYDTPMIQAYIDGYWDEAVRFIRAMFQAAFKDNACLERGLLTGITRVARESIFSGMNNLEVCTILTKGRYETALGFTEQEVFEALDTYGLGDKKDDVKKWYDGYKIGNATDIYNPWSVINFLKNGDFAPYWMNSSGNDLVEKLVRVGDEWTRQEFETLLSGKSVMTLMNEFTTYQNLTGKAEDVWNFLMTSGYLKVVSINELGDVELALTNYEVQMAMGQMVNRWFNAAGMRYVYFMRELLTGKLETIQRYMSDILMRCISYWDVGNGDHPTDRTESFYHGFTLGLIANFNQTHDITSNREAGFGRYDLCLSPKNINGVGAIFEFKLFDEKQDTSLEDTAQRALAQIETQSYAADMIAKGVTKIRKFGFGFKGKEVLIRLVEC